MHTSESLKIVRDRFLTVAAVALATVVVAVVVSMLLPREYSSRIVFYVSAQSGNNATTAYQGGLLSQARVTSYVQLISSPAVTGPVVSSLALDETPKDLARKISASSTSQSVLIEVNVSDSSPSGAQEVADAVGRVFPQLVSGLERPLGGSTDPAVTVRVVENASLPEVPDNVSPLIVGIVALIVGLGLGCAFVILREKLDSSIRTVENLQKASGAPVLAAVTALRGDGPEERDRAFQESFNRLRTNLRFMDVDRDSRVYVVSSSMPGEGKSTVSRNLAVACGKAGMSVLLVDADLRRPTLAAAVGLEGSVGLSTVIAGGVEASVAIQRWQAGSIDVLTSGAIPPNPSEILGSRRMRDLVNMVKMRYDIVLFDTPPLGPVIDAAGLSVSCDGVLIVAHAGEATSASVEGAVESVATVNGRVLGAVLNFAESQKGVSYSEYYGPQDSAEVATAEVHREADHVANRGGSFRRQFVSSAGDRPRPGPRRQD